MLKKVRNMKVSDWLKLSQEKERKYLRNAAIDRFSDIKVLKRHRVNDPENRQK